MVEPVLAVGVGEAVVDLEVDEDDARHRLYSVDRSALILGWDWVQVLIGCVGHHLLLCVVVFVPLMPVLFPHAPCVVSCLIVIALCTEPKMSNHVPHSFVVFFEVLTKIDVSEVVSHVVGRTAEDDINYICKANDSKESSCSHRATLFKEEHEGQNDASPEDEGSYQCFAVDGAFFFLEFVDILSELDKLARIGNKRNFSTNFLAHTDFSYVSLRLFFIGVACFFHFNLHFKQKRYYDFNWRIVKDFQGKYQKLK